MLKLEVMNEATNFLLLYHVQCFSGLVPDAADRYLLGWSFIVIISLNIFVHFTLLVIETINNMRQSAKKRCCKKKLSEEEIEKVEKLSIQQIRHRLSVIEEEELQSNFTDSVVDVRVSCSEWDSQLGGTEYGYNMQKIRWDDLGLKFTNKGGQLSRFVNNCGASSRADILYDHFFT